MNSRRTARVALMTVLMVGCAAAPDSETVELQIEALNASGVSGTVTLAALDATTTLVSVDVDDAGHASMPAHVHAGSCADLVPQPRYALENVVDGRSSTEVAASLDELLSGGQALNIHRSNEEMDVYTACVDLAVADR